MVGGFSISKCQGRAYLQLGAEATANFSGNAQSVAEPFPVGQQKHYNANHTDVTSDNGTLDHDTGIPLLLGV